MRLRPRRAAKEKVTEVREAAREATEASVPAVREFVQSTGAAAKEFAQATAQAAKELLESTERAVERLDRMTAPRGRAGRLLKAGLALAAAGALLANERVRRALGSGLRRLRGEAPPAWEAGPSGDGEQRKETAASGAPS